MAALSSSGATAPWRARNKGQSSTPSVKATSSVATDQKSSIKGVGQAIEESAAAACVAKSAHYTGAAAAMLIQLCEDGASA
jgi:hypothetical protein